MSDTFDPKVIKDNLDFLKRNPQFEEKPATIREFMGDGYLGIGGLVRPGIMESLEDIFGKRVNGKYISQVQRAMITGGIGIGKTTFASIALPYMCHWVLCLKDPQKFYSLLPGSRIAFMQMSTSEKQASEVVFGDIFARIKHSKWFMENYPYDDKFTKQIRFPKDIWILPGDSAETTFEGYNILGGILDEADSHKITLQKDYAETGYDTIHSRIDSRFIDSDREGHKGLLIVIGQMKKAEGFAAKKFKELSNDPQAHVKRMTIWESLGWDMFLNKDGTRDSFHYDTKRKKIVPSGVVGLITAPNLIEVPSAYRKNFENNPQKALRDLAGIPPEVTDPFIALLDKIDTCRDKWIDRYGDEFKDGPVDSTTTRPKIAAWFRADGDPRKRALHIDYAFSGEGDALGLAMGHVEEVVEIDGEVKPYIVLDLLYRVKAAPGTEIILADIRRLIYDLKDERHFRIKDVTMDGFQSTDTQQQLRKRRFRVDYLSVDRSTLPYEDLREAIYEERLEFPPYMTYLNRGDDQTIDIAYRELSQLQEGPKKVDHPPGGSKDVADAMAGVVSTLMGDRTYRRRLSSRQLTDPDLQSDEPDSATEASSVRDLPLRAPIPVSGSNLLGLSIPPRLQQRGDR